MSPETTSVRGLPAVFPSGWACGWGEDRHGVFAEIALGAEARGEEVTLELRWIPAGRFLMGSPEGEAGRWDDEGPQHEVTLTRGFWLGTTPVTQAQWRAVMGTNPSQFQDETKHPDRARRPVEQVSWDACGEFCAKVAALVPGLGARRPSEAEWEYACRAGTTTAWNDGSDYDEKKERSAALEKLGWYAGNSGGETHAVGQKRPNSWGLRDMHGQVGEWCEDRWSYRYEAEPQIDPTGPANGGHRVFRGGGWFSGPRFCRSAYRDGIVPGFRSGDLGFRLAAGQ